VQTIARDPAAGSGARLTITDDLAAVRGADFRYTDVWLSMGEPAGEWDSRIDQLIGYQVNADVMAATGNPEVKFDRHHRSPGMKVAVALGGNALLQRGEPPDSDIQEKHVADAVDALTPVLRGHDVVITHGNGPQVGLLALESASDPALSRPYPFDVLGAQTQGMIGYWLVQALQRAVPGKAAVCLICRTLVHADDPGFGHPSKFVGPVYDKATALLLAADHGWDVREDGQAWRRVVPSPEPAELVELDTIRLLMRQGVIVVCAGGGGIPVVDDGSGMLRGVEAVVDKDLTAAVLARAVGADALLLLTDVDAVIDGYGTPRARPVRRATTTEMRARSFPRGSMGPKVEAACRFVEATGAVAAIGRLDHAAALLDGTAGTTVVPAT
jgi:carbamate kinase